LEKEDDADKVEGKEPQYQRVGVDTEYTAIKKICILLCAIS